MLIISYIEHKKNEEVLNMMKTMRSLFDSIRKGRLNVSGVWKDKMGYRDTRRENTQKRGKGRPRSTWATNIKEWTGKKYGECESCGEQARMEVHNSQPAWSGRHIMMMMVKNGLL